MHSGRVIWLEAVSGVVCLLVGCQAPPAASFAHPPAAAVRSSLSADGLRRAQALAEYGAAQLDEFNKDPAGALRHYEEAARLDPDNEALQMKTAQGLLQQNRNQEALTILRALVARHPDSERALNWLALAYQTTDQGDRAVDVYERIVKLTPQQSASYLKLSALLVTQGKDEVALKWLERGMRQAQHSPDLYRGYADLFARHAVQARTANAAHAARVQALNIMERACHEFPNDNALLTGLAELYIADGQFGKALACHASLEARVGGQLPFRSHLALSYAAGGQRAAAVAFFEQNLKERPSDERVWFYLGELREADNDAVRAEIAFRHAAEHASSPLTAIRLAVFLVQHSQTNAALNATQAALQRWPEQPLLLQLEAYLHIEQHAYAQAMADFARSLSALRNNPDEKIPPELFSRYAVAAFKAGKADDCVELLVQGVQLDDDVTINFIQEMFAAKEPADAHALARILQRVAQRLPDNPNPLIHLGFVRYVAEDYPAASLAFAQAQQVGEAHGQSEFNAPFFFWFGASCERMGQFERAEKLLLQALELEPENAEALNYLAYMWSEKGLHLERALAFSRKALLQEPENGAYLDTLGWIFYQQGRYQDALPPLTKAAELVPDDATITDHLGDLYLKLNQPQQAVKYWTTSYQLDSANEVVAKKLRAQGLDPAKLLLPASPDGKSPSAPKPAT